MISLLFLFFFFLQSSLATFDFFMLAETWPPSFCKNNHCSGKPLAKFTIHGLWPQNNSGPQPSQCQTSYTFRASNDLRGTLKSKLNTNWPSLTGGNNGFWEHEWTAHGTCSMLKPNEYFTFALNLHNKQINIKDILYKGKIKSGGSEPIPKHKILETIKSRINDKVPQLVCDNSGNLLEVRICFDKSNNPNYQDCSSSTTCGDDVHFPYD